MRKTPLKRGGRIKPKKRSASDFARVYGSKERVAFVANLPCLVLFCRSKPSENMHIRGDGLSRKADARWIVPACNAHHREAHRIGIESFANRYFLDLAWEAAQVEARWLAYSA